MFIELTTHDYKIKEPIPVRRIKHWDEHVDGGSRVFLTTADGDCEWGKSFHAAESPDAIRAALLKAGLLVLVEEEAKATKPPLEYPPASKAVDLSKAEVEGLCQLYAFWHRDDTDHPDDMRSAVIAELQRRIESKLAQVVVKLWIQRLPDSMHPNMVSVYVKNRYTKATVTQWCEESRAKEWAESMVRVVNPSARIEWENET